jgi:hypothetical protein
MRFLLLRVVLLCDRNRGAGACAPRPHIVSSSHRRRRLQCWRCASQQLLDRLSAEQPRSADLHAWDLADASLHGQCFGLHPEHLRDFVRCQDISFLYAITPFQRNAFISCPGEQIACAPKCSVTQLSPSNCRAGTRNRDERPCRSAFTSNSRAVSAPSSRRISEMICAVKLVREIYTSPSRVAFS